MPQVSKAELIKKLRRKLKGEWVIAAELHAAGGSEREIAKHLGTTQQTVNTYFRRPLVKLLYMLLLKDRTRLAEKILQSKAPAVADKMLKIALESKSEFLSAQTGMKLLRGMQVLVENQRITASVERPYPSPGKGKEPLLQSDERDRMVVMLIDKPSRPAVESVSGGSQNGRTIEADVVGGSESVAEESSEPDPSTGVG